MASEPAPTQRDITLAAMARRPRDLWSRAVGHVVLGYPGSRLPQKAYHESGGSFSPEFGAFGISIWAIGPDGSPTATSDTIPLEQVRQQFGPPGAAGVPSVTTQTPHYHATWSHSGDGSWRLRLNPLGTGVRLAVVIRSVGPAGGPITALEWNGRLLVVNERWQVSMTPAPQAVHLVSEEEPGWQTAAGRSDHIASEDGWATARLDLGAAPVELTILDTRAPKADPLPSSRGAVSADLPDSRFAECLVAQQYHLLMGLEGDQTRPGDPANYPLNWLRDGAYVISALARAGHLDAARRLCVPFAEHDFFGGFGAEADGPGLALWAVDETAARLHDAGFDLEIWSHARRKAELILAMLSAREPMRSSYLGPIVPAHARQSDLDLVCLPARDGLIHGRMDWHFPILFVNAVSYRGLLCAADIADRLGESADSTSWRGTASALKQAWERGLRTAESGNERTFICGLYPTGVAGGIRTEYEAAMESRWKATRDPSGAPRERPLWTYFTAAEAHQWLFLNRPDRALRTLEWFWQNQVLPGLYTWWEGNGEENTFGLWEGVRGWVRPPYVTSHYWTAAEILLLQLDMLACVDDSGDEAVLVIGAGIPADWTRSPMNVRGIRTRYGAVEWRWRNGRLSVRVHGRSVRVQPGPGFAGAKMSVRFDI